MNINPSEKAYGILELQVSLEIPIKFSLKFYGQDDRIIVLGCIFVYNKRISFSVFQNRITFNNILKRLINKHYSISSGAFLIIQEGGCSIIANPLSVFRLFAFVSFKDQKKILTNNWTAEIFKRH